MVFYTLFENPILDTFPKEKSGNLGCNFNKLPVNCVPRKSTLILAQNPSLNLEFSCQYIDIIFELKLPTLSKALNVCYGHLLILAYLVTFLLQQLSDTDNKSIFCTLFCCLSLQQCSTSSQWAFELLLSSLWRQDYTLLWMQRAICTHQWVKHLLCLLGSFMCCAL